MSRITVNRDQEARLLIGMITSDRFLRDILPVFRTYYLAASYSKIIAGWCVEYYEAFKKAPGKDILSIYKEKRGAILEEEDADNVSLILTRLSKSYEESVPNNVEYSISEAIKYLKRQSLQMLKDNLEEALKVNDETKAEQAVSTYTRVEKPFGAGVSLLHDTDKVTMAFSDEDEALFKFPGALGDVAGTFGRGDFVSFLGPMKRGKTWWLWYAAETAIHYSLKVVFFTLEMTENQMIRRAWRSLMGQPKKSGKVNIPGFEYDEESKLYRVVVSEEERKGLDPSAIGESQLKYRRRFRKGDVKIIALPAYSASPEDLDSHLDNLEYYDNFIPDVIVVDYADILIPNKGFRGEYRHQLDSIWKCLRKMAQERNALGFTASQAEKKTFKADVQQADVAEDIRKLAHVTHMLSLNQTKAEAERGIMRVAQTAIREGRATFDQAIVLQCLDIGRPCLTSKLKKEVKLDEVQKEMKYVRKNGKD